MVRRRRAELCQMRPPNATVRLRINSSGSGDLAVKSPESARNDANRHWLAASAAVISGSGDRPERRSERFGPIPWPGNALRGRLKFPRNPPLKPRNF
jgi:hypothetical protein